MDRAARRNVFIEGYTAEDILTFSNEELEQFVFLDEPIVLRAGSAEILGKFERTADRMIIELAHIEGEGEGVLPAIRALASKYVQRERLEFLEWRIHAVHCVNPNLKLRRVLEKHGFEVKEVQGVECYHFVERSTLSNNSLESDTFKSMSGSN